MADLRENVIEFYKDDKTVTGSFTQGKYISKIRKLAEQYPDECQITAENKDGSICCHFPTRWVKISANKSNRVMSEEEKEEKIRSLREWREKQNTSQNKEND